MNNKYTTWDDMFTDILKMTREYEVATSWAMTLKLGEEVGELNEVILHDHGYLQYKDKEWKDTAVGEAADIINTLLGMLQAHYPDKTPDEISQELLLESIRKGKKYGRILGAGTDVFT